MGRCEFDADRRGIPSRRRPGTPAAIHETKPIRSSSAIITAEKILPLILRFRISPSGSFWRITQPAASAIGPYGERAKAGKERRQNDAWL